MAYEVGRRFGPYEVRATVGSGGMGVVYRAYDTRLNRPVALKFINPDDVPGDGEEWRRRLLHEARAASALNHPAICHIYDIGGEGAECWIAMEYVEGKPLDAIIPPDGLPEATVVDLGGQLARALAHAHERGVLHRDLKSRNVVVDESGRIRLLDFGIATRLPEAVAQELTRTLTVSHPGAIEGTPPYMAPEVLRGEPSSAASDLWSLGVLLYEMRSGGLPFRGETSFALASAILDRDPPPLPARVSPALQRIVLRLLAKEPHGRYQTAAEAAAALEALAAPARVAGTVGPRWLWARAVVFAAVAILALGGYLAWRALASSPLQVSEQRLLSTSLASERAPAYSPDGRRLAFVAPDQSGVPQVWIRNTSESTAIQITSGEPGASRPRWSGREDRIVFARGDLGIWSVSAHGGTPNRLTEFGLNPALSSDGERLVFEFNRTLWTGRPDGSEVRRVEGMPPVYYSIPMGPALSPDGSQIAFFRPNIGPNGDLWVIPVEGGDARRLTFDQREGGWPVWTPDGERIVFSSARAGSRTLWQIQADGGDPRPLTTGAGEDDQPTISADGRQLVYTSVRNSWELRTRDLATGSEQTLHQRALELLFPMFSPDGRRIVFFGRQDLAVAIFTIGSDGSDLRQLTGGSELNHQPRWGSDGVYVYFFQAAPDAGFRRVPAVGGPSAGFREWRWETHNAPLFDPSGRYISYMRQSPPDAGDPQPPRTVIHEIATREERVWPEPITYVTGWSADGTQVVGWRRDGTVVVCDALLAACRMLTRGTQPVWPAGSQRIFFRRSAERGGGQELWAIGAGGGDESFVASLGTFRPIDRFFDVSSQGVAVWAPFEAGSHQLWLAILQ